MTHACLSGEHEAGQARSIDVPRCHWPRIFHPFTLNVPVTCKGLDRKIGAWNLGLKLLAFVRIRLGIFRS